MQKAPQITNLSIAIITCNNQRTIENTLKSVVGLTDKIIVVDSGSDDITKEICTQYNTTIDDKAWQGHIKQKQYALELCDTEWVLSLDSDEAIDETLCTEVRRVILEDDSTIDGYEVNRRVWMCGKWLNHTWQPEWRLRLVRRAKAHWCGYDPHDKLTVSSNRTGRINGLIRHDAFENVADMIRKQINHGLRAAESYHAMGKKGSITSLLVSPIAAISKQLILKGAWRDGWQGCVAATATGITAAVKHMQLLQLTYQADQAEKSEIPPSIPD